MLPTPEPALDRQPLREKGHQPVLKHASVGLPDDGHRGTRAPDQDVRRALLRSDLPGPARGLVHALLTVADYRTLTTPPEFTPSLATLATISWYSEATVKRELNRLEVAGRVIRIRPAVADARAGKTRTRYRMTVPAGLTVSPEESGGGLRKSPELGSGRATGWAQGEPQALPSPHSPSSSSGDALDEHEPGTGQTGHDQAPAVEVDPHGDDVQAVIRDGGVPASWDADLRAALDRGCTVGQILDAYRAPITGTVRNPAAVRRTRIRDLAPEPARPAGPTVAVPPNVRSMCRQHGQPGPCPVCADLEATRAATVLDEGQAPAAAGGLEEPASVVLSAATLDTLTAVRTRLPKQVGPGRRRRR